MRSQSDDILIETLAKKREMRGIYEKPKREIANEPAHTFVWCAFSPRCDDTTFVDQTSYDDRTIYNCFINSAVECRGSMVGRTFTHMDLFATTLSAMGFQIEGERLGLGVNLFSTIPTLAEQMSFEWLDEELSKHSAYYNLRFS